MRAVADMKENEIEKIEIDNVYLPSPVDTNANAVPVDNLMLAPKILALHFSTNFHNKLQAPALVADNEKNQIFGLLTVALKKKQMELEHFKTWLHVLPPALVLGYLVGTFIPALGYSNYPLSCC